LEKTLAELKKGEKGTITTICTEQLPLKLIEMGCLPGSEVTLLQTAPFSCPLYLNINDSYLAIRRTMAEKINIKISTTYTN